MGAVERLRSEPGKNLLILGSGELFRSLLRANLVDEVTLQIHPLVLGSGLRLFGEDGTLARFDLAEFVDDLDRRRGRDVPPGLTPQAATTPSGSPVGTPTSIGLLSGSWLHSNQPPSYTAIRDQPWIQA